VLQVEKVGESVLKVEKVGESVLNATANADCCLFAVQMLIIFDAQYKSLLPFLGGGEGVCVCVEVSLRTACCCQKLEYLQN